MFRNNSVLETQKNDTENLRREKIQILDKLLIK